MVLACTERDGLVEIVEVDGRLRPVLAYVAVMFLLLCLLFEFAPFYFSPLSDDMDALLQL